MAACGTARTQTNSRETQHLDDGFIVVQHRISFPTQCHDPDREGTAEAPAAAEVGRRRSGKQRSREELCRGVPHPAYFSIWQKYAASNERNIVAFTYVVIAIG